MRRPSIVTQWLEEWLQLNFYERFEQIIAVVLSWIVSIIVLLSLLRLGYNAAVTLADPAALLEYETFVSLFGMIMVVLIALEFNHTIVQIVERKQSIIQIRVVLIIAMLAIIRKFVIIDMENPDNITVVSLAGVVLALGAVYWLVQNSDRRTEKAAARGQRR
jgi:uncharacterized membrane protein (DUF373 family)